MKPMIFAAVFALGLVALSNARAEVVTIGISTIGLYELPTEISKRKGFYQEEGLEALAAGSVDAPPLDVAYIQKTEQLGFTNLLYLGDAVNLRLGGFAVSQDKIQRNPDQITRTIRATLKGVRFLKNNKPETLAIMRDYLKIGGDYVDKVYQFALRCLNEDGLVAKTSLDNEIRLAREQLKIKEEVPESKIADWRFIREILAKK